MLGEWRAVCLLGEGDLFMAKAKKKKAKAKAKPKKAARKVTKRAAKKAAKKAARKVTKRAVKKAVKKTAKKSAKKAASKPARKAAKKSVKKAAAKAAPAQPVMVHGVICHIEIPSDDVGSAKQFYGDVFGWTFQEMPMGESTYTMYQTRQGGIGGGITTPPPGAPKQTVNYILVNDIAPVLEQVRRAGGDVVTPVMEVPGAGWLAHFTDPDGNLFGLWKPAMGGQG
jgi:predicted enzyme related to lactoylglutathione lyase